MASIIKPIMLDETGQAIANTLNTIKNNIAYVKGDKGDKGNKGDKGDKGNDYIITNEDYDAIADVTKPKVVTQIQPQINEIELIAKGANQALSYASYSAMITAFNSASSTDYNVGQNIYIETLEVPDLWVYKVESTSSTYTYTTDSAIVTALETNGYVQVGYYKLSALETQKVDLTDYVSNTDYANSTNAGVIKTSSAGGISVDSQDGVASIVQSTTSEIDARTQNHKPITPNNLEYAVKSVVGGHTTLTQAQYDALVSGGTVDSNTFYYTTEDTQE